MPSFPPIVVRQPQPYDLVDLPVRICGVGTGFEGVIAARLRDANGSQLVQVSISVGGTGIWGNYEASLNPGAAPSTPQGTLEVFEVSAKDGSDVNKVVVPVTFGPVLIDPYHGFAQYTVVSGDTLFAIAQHWYSNGALWTRVYEANRDQIADPDVIFPGQVLRIPQ